LQQFSRRALHPKQPPCARAQRGLTTIDAVKELKIVPACRLVEFSIRREDCSSVILAAINHRKVKCFDKLVQAKSVCDKYLQ